MKTKQKKWLYIIIAFVALAIIIIMFIMFLASPPPSEAINNPLMLKQKYGL